MKNIELTEEHKSKLLEMCNKLFPEHKEIVLTKQNTLKFGFKKHGSYISWKTSGFHWFEFCMTHLYQIIKQVSGNVNCHSCIKKEHPIDYLYEEFLKLKI